MKNLVKVFKANKDFTRAFVSDVLLNEKVLIKSNFATGWGTLAKVTRILNTQIEVEIINIVPTEESNRFGTKNGWDIERKENPENFFLRWAEWKKRVIGTKRKFFKETGIEVGSTNSTWRSSSLCTFIIK